MCRIQLGILTLGLYSQHDGALGHRISDDLPDPSPRVASERGRGRVAGSVQSIHFRWLSRFGSIRGAMANLPRQAKISNTPPRGGRIYPLTIEPVRVLTNARLSESLPDDLDRAGLVPEILGPSISQRRTSLDFIGESVVF
jgi:hypothetical protein